MRAGRYTSVTLVLIVTAIATAVRIITHWAFDFQTAPELTRVLVFAAVVAVVTAGVLVPMGYLLDRAINRLRGHIEASAKHGVPITPNRTKWLQPVTRALVGAVDEFRQREQALRAQLGDLEIRHRVSEADRRQIEAVLHALRDAVIVTDAFNEVVMVNHAAASILRFDQHGAIHQSIEEVIQNERLRQLIRDARNAGDFSNARHVELGLSANDAADGGKPTGAETFERVFDVTLAAIANHKHEVGGVVTILHDLSREREISQMKSDFVAKASHELRTPLSSIRAYVEMLVDGEAGDERSRQEFYRVMQGEADRLGRLIDNMLNISRIEAGIVHIEREHVDVKALVHRAVHTLEPQAIEKNIDLHVRLTDLQLCVEGDGDMLYQVVLNLLSNAVKYTPEGGRVTVSADCTGIGMGGKERSATESRQPTAARSELLPSVVVTISDTGLGIPPDSLPKLFDKFYRVENYKRVAKGTGLGLNLCKHIVETVHRGQVGVESKLGMGSKFWFSVPMRYQGGVASADRRVANTQNVERAAPQGKAA